MALFVDSSDRATFLPVHGRGNASVELATAMVDESIDGWPSRPKKK